VDVTGQEQRFRRLFADEAESRLATLSELLLELEATGGDPELLASVFREAHTLKGAAAVVGLADVSRVAHAMEEALEGVRRDQRAATPALVDALLGTVDGMREMVRAVLAGEDRAGQADRLVASLAEADAPAPAAPTPAPAAPAAAEAPPPNAAQDPGAAGPPTAQAGSPAPAPAAGDRPRAPAGGPGKAGADSIRVPVQRLDEMVRLVGEAAASYLRVGRLLSERLGVDPGGVPELHELSRVLGDLQQRTLQARMVPFATIAEPLRRAARDLSRSLGKTVEFELRGQETELDRGVLDQVADPLLHLLRNAIDHGVEPPAERQAAGKPSAATVRVHAMQLGSEVVVTVTDDGRGIDVAGVRERASASGADLGDVADEEAVYAIFRSGLSTARSVTELSGRGVGLDVVRASLEAVRGRVQVRSEPGAGTEFRISVPVTLAVLACLLVEAGGQRYGIPMHSVVTAEAAGRGEASVEGQTVIRVRDEVLPVSSLAATLGAGEPAQGPAVVVASLTRRHAFEVDALVGQRDVVVKELGPLLRGVEVVAGASVEPDGSILLVLDATSLVDRARRAGPAPSVAARQAPAPAPASRPEHPGQASILVVDDAPVVRELERSILERAGYQVRTAADGVEALERLTAAPVDLVITDVDMPRCDGFELTRAIRAEPRLAGLPVVILTSNADDADRRRGLDAGADAYVVKSDFDEAALLQVVGRLLGDVVAAEGAAAPGGRP
jgi:two-component system, chemotaxis family, sensor kinase CheA